MAGKLDGKVALVTGAARGQGRSHAVELAREGAAVIAVDICAGFDSVTAYPPATPEDLAETARLIEALDRRAVTRQADVRDRGALATVVGEGVAELGRLDVVVANAGIAPTGSESTIESFFDTVGINFGGVHNTVEAAWPHLAEGASIVLIGSMAAMMGMGGGAGMPDIPPGAVGYTFAKRSVGRYAHELADLLAPRGIRVNAIHPGNIKTPMLLNDSMYRTFRPDLENPTLEDAEIGFRAMHRMPVSMIDPKDISNAVVYLASDDSRYVTGLQLKVEAGALLRTSPSGIPG